jgi:hypothetical protein
MEYTMPTLRLAAFTLLAPALFAADEARFLGVWRVQEAGVPALVMTISNEGGGLSGAVLFYMIRRDENQPVRSTPGIPEPLFRLKSKGDTLRFQVSHKRSHGARTANDPPVKFRLVVKSPGEGVLYNEDDAETPGGYPIVRDKAP